MGTQETPASRKWVVIHGGALLPPAAQRRKRRASPPPDLDPSRYLRSTSCSSSASLPSPPPSFSCFLGVGVVGGNEYTRQLKVGERGPVLSSTSAFRLDTYCL
jgi:hypothetical protein